MPVLYHSVIYMMIVLFNHHSQTKNELFYYIICQRFIWYNNLYSVLRVILSQSLLKLFWKLFIFCQHACLASQNWQSIDNFATNVLNNHMQRTAYSLVRPIFGHLLNQKYNGIPNRPHLMGRSLCDGDTNGGYNSPNNIHRMDG